MEEIVMENDRSTITDLEFAKSDFVRQVDIGLKRNSISVGPYQPIQTGAYNIISYETFNFEDVEIIEVI